MKNHHRLKEPRAMYFSQRQSHQPSSSSYPTGTCALLTMVLAVASSLRLHAETGTSRNAVFVGPEVTWTESPTTNQTTATTAAAATMFGGRHGDRRRHVIRGEREAAVITRLPQMKVHCLLLILCFLFFSVIYSMVKTTTDETVVL